MKLELNTYYTSLKSTKFYMLYISSCYYLFSFVFLYSGIASIFQDLGLLRVSVGLGLFLLLAFIGTVFIKKYIFWKKVCTAYDKNYEGTLYKLFKLKE